MTKASATRRAGPKEIAYVAMPRRAVVARARPRRGETIRAFVTRQGWERRGLPVVCATGQGEAARPILRKDWDRKIRPSDDLTFIAMPLGGGATGGGSKQIGAIVAMIAIIAIATMVAGPAGTAAALAIGGSAAVWTAVISAAIIAGGSLLISHFLTPKAGGKDDAREADPLSITVGGNRARPQQPIPVHYGRLKFFPDFASAPWGDYRGKDQVFHGLYSLGVGAEWEIEEIGFNTTPVWTAADGASADFETFTHEVVGPGDPVTLFPSNVAVSPDVAGQELHQSETVGPFIVNSPGTVGARLAIDLVWPGGSYYNNPSTGAAFPPQTEILVEYRYVNDAGVAIGAGTWATAASLFYEFWTKVAARKTAVIELPSAGRVQVRVTRTNVVTDTSGNNIVVWAGARLYLRGSETRPAVTLLAVEMVSDRQLSAYSAQQVYVIATRKIPVWSGIAWVDTATANPYWAAVDMWHNSDYGGGQSRDKIDLATIAALAAEADVRGDTFNHRFVSEMTVLEGIEAILRPVLAQPVYVFDRLSIIRDEERVAARQLLTDFEISRGSLQLDMVLQNEQSADGVIVEYIEELTWLRAEVSSTGSLADLSHPARVQAPGLTNRRQATLFARYMAAVTRYRRTTATLVIEAEGKLLRRGDLVKVQTELPQTWGQGFRLESYAPGSRTLTLHGPADWSGGPNFYVLLRTTQGAPFGPLLATQGASASLAVIDAADLAAVQTAQGMTIAQALARSSKSEPATLSFSASQPREFEGLVSRLANAGEGKFSLTLVRDAPEVYEIDDADVPELPDAPPLSLPQVPGVIDGLNARLVQEGAALTLFASWRPDPGSQSYTAQINYVTDPDVAADAREWTTIYPAGYEALFHVAGVADNDVRLRVRGATAAGLNGPWTQATVTSPGLDLTPTGLGYEIAFADLASAAVDAILAEGVVVADVAAEAAGVKLTIAAGTTPAGTAAAFDVKVQGGPAATPAQSGLRLEVYETSPGSGSYASRIVMLAEQFYVGDPTHKTVPFAIVSGSVYMQSAMIKDASIETLKIGAEQVTIPRAAYTAAGVASAGLFTLVLAQALTLTLTQASAVVVRFSGMQNTASGGNGGMLGVVIDGVTVRNPIFAANVNNPGMDHFVSSMTAGSHTFQVYWGQAVGVTLTDRFLSVFTAMR